jgi:penicillin-binding protein 1A
MPTKTKRKRSRKRRSWVWRYRRLLYLFGLLLFTALAGAAYVISQIPLPKAAAGQAQTSFFVDAAGNQLAVLHGGENRVPVTYDRMPKVLIDAVVATEDRNYFTHGGLDPIGIARATWADIRHKKAVQGGSTITQQYVKNVYLGRERTFVRKLKEAVIAVKLERKYDKKQILERYLNTIYFGRGAYGVQAAARAYFAKDVAALTLPEAAFLAGAIRSPVAADPIRNVGLAATVRDRALAAMVRAKAITPAERFAAEQQPVTVVAPAAAATTYSRSDKGTQYFVDYVRQELVARFGEDLVLRGGLRVKTTLDMRAQVAAYDAVYGLLNRATDPAGALVAIDADGRVIAMVGGRDWETSRVNLATGVAGGGGGRQGGSAFKPFVLAEAVKEGYTVSSALPGPPKIVLPKADRGRDWEVNNYEKESFDRLNLVDATVHSVNTVYAQIVAAVGPDKVVDMAHKLGITSPLNPVVSITLGTQNVSVLEMADAYLTFSQGGVQVKQRVVEKVTLTDGTVLEDTRSERTRVLDRGQADVVNFVLKQVVDHGTGTGAQFGRPMAGKTGTTENYGDAWFVGYTPQLSAAVWMGYPSGQSKSLAGVHGVAKLNGGSLPATIFSRFMSAVAKSVDSGDFVTPKSFPGRLLPSAGRIPAGSTTTSSPPGSTTSGPPPSRPGPTTPPTAAPPATGPKSTTTSGPSSPPTTKAGLP